MSSKFFDGRVWDWVWRFSSTARPGEGTRVKLGGNHSRRMDGLAQIHSAHQTGPAGNRRRQCARASSALEVTGTELQGTRAAMQPALQHSAIGKEHRVSEVVPESSHEPTYPAAPFERLAEKPVILCRRSQASSFSQRKSSASSVPSSRSRLSSVCLTTLPPR